MFRHLIHSVLLVGIAALPVASPAQTTPRITLSVTPSAASGQAVPTLTWSTAPAAASCLASGGWTGNQAASGTQTLAPISSSTAYTLTCQFAADASATLTWVAPTQNTDQTPLVDLASYFISYGPTAAATGSLVSVEVPALTKTINGLAPGPVYFVIQAVNRAGAKSAWTGPVSKTLRTATAVVQSAAVSITAVPVPAIPTGLVVQ